MPDSVYLDYNATTPLHPLLVPFVHESLVKFGNASSVHKIGRAAKRVISQSREVIARYLNCTPLELVFTSGGSEGNNMALKETARFFPPERREIICSKVEHPSVIKTVETLGKLGFEIKWLNVTREGAIDLAHLDQILSSKTALVTVQLVNNETGNIFPIKDIAKKAHKAGALMHSDMVQALGKIPVDLKDLDMDLATFAGHKFYSLKGVGLLYIKKGTRIASLIDGGGQERGRRAGTENALAIGVFGEAVQLLGPRTIEMGKKIQSMREAFEKRIKAEIENCIVNGERSPRVPNTSNVTFENIDGETLLINLDTRGFAVSSGAACSSGSQEPSLVLRGMGFSPEHASQSIRVSLGWMTSDQDLENFFTTLKSSVAQMRETKRAMAQAEEIEA